MGDNQSDLKASLINLKTEIIEGMKSVQESTVINNSTTPMSKRNTFFNSFLLYIANCVWEP